MLPEPVCNQLHSDRQTFSNTDRNIQAGEAERRHRHEWTLLTNQAPHAFRAEQILSPTEWKLARSRHEHERVSAQEHVPLPTHGIALFERIDVSSHV